MKYEYYRSNAYFMKRRRTLKQETRVSMNYSNSPSGEYSLRLLKETYAVPTCSSNSYGMDTSSMHQTSPSIRLTNVTSEHCLHILHGLHNNGDPLLHHKNMAYTLTPQQGRAFNFTAQLRQLRVRGEPCHEAAALSGSLRVLNICPHLGKLSIQLTAQHFSLRKHSQTFPLRT